MYIVFGSYRIVIIQFISRATPPLHTLVANIPGTRREHLQDLWPSDPLIIKDGEEEQLRDEV